MPIRKKDKDSTSNMLDQWVTAQKEDAEAEEEKGKGQEQGSNPSQSTEKGGSDGLTTESFKKGSSQRPEVKQAVIDKETVKANTRPGRKLIKVAGFHGPYLDAVFGDDGVSKEPVRPDTLKHLKRDFPFAEVEEIEEVEGE